MLVIFGTSAEWIKLKPIVMRLIERSVSVQLLRTFQQYGGAEEDVDLYSSVDLRRDPRQQSLSSVRSACLWSLRIIPRMGMYFWRTKRAGPRLVVVHGDTMTAAIGAIVAKAMNLQVAHVEAGLRSGSLRSPFPEEICRIIIGVLADIHFAPNQEAVEVLKGGHRRSRKIVMTEGNTSFDALRDAISHGSTEEAAPSECADDDFSNRALNILCVLHRAELMLEREAVTRVWHAIAEIAASHRVLWVCDDFARANLRREGLLSEQSCYSNDVLNPADLFLSKAGDIRVIQKQTHSKFVELLRHANLVITDSGGLQEECAALGKPCVVLREVSERPDGIGENVVLLPPNDVVQLSEIVHSYKSMRRPVVMRGRSPSDVIVNELLVHLGGVE